MEDAELTCEEVTFREMGKALNGISPNLQFTFEKPSEFTGEWLPTLDFKIKVDHIRNRYTHTYYKKPMYSK